MNLFFPTKRAFALFLILPLMASVFALALNSIRSKGIELIAPFSYEHDCPEKLVITSPRVEVKKIIRSIKSLSKEIALVDARPKELFDAKHIKGALNYPYSFIQPFSQRDALVFKKKKYTFVYCDSPHERLAGVQAELMKKMGVKGVKIVVGGLASLIAEGAQFEINEKKESDQ